MVPAYGKALSLAGKSVETKGELQGYQKSASSGLWQAGQSETYTDGPCTALHSPNLRCVVTGAHGGLVLECTFGEQTQGEECYWL